MFDQRRKLKPEESLASGVMNRVQRAWSLSPFYQMQLDGPAPDRMSHRPADPYSRDAEIGRALLGGVLTLGAEKFDFEGELENMWPAADRNPALFAFMHEFQWLKHLSAVGADAKGAAQKLARQWFDEQARVSPTVWEPYRTSERLINLCSFGAFILADGDALWRSQVLSSMARQVRHLAITCHQAPSSYERLKASISLCIAALCLPGCEAVVEKGSEMVRREVRLQIRADGGHISRNPSRQLELVVRLKMFAEALQARHIEKPAFLKHIVRRSASYLQLFRTGDGRLAIFNGGYEDDSAALASVACDAEGDAEFASFARDSGFQRLESGRGVLVVDVGASSGKSVAGRPYESGASFHFSSGRGRIITNCGAGAHLGGDWSCAMRQAAAHSTLSSSSSALTASLLRKCHATHRRGEDRRGQLLEVSRSFEVAGATGPVTHVRRFFLEARGDDMRGEDFLSAALLSLDTDWKLRFHLHPGVRASLARDGKSVILALSNKEGWRFRTNASNIYLEKSIYCGERGLPAANEQIVIAPDVRAGEGAGNVIVKWGINRMEGL